MRSYSGTTLELTRPPPSGKSRRGAARRERRSRCHRTTIMSPEGASKKSSRPLCAQRAAEAPVVETCQRPRDRARERADEDLLAADSSEVYASHCPSGETAAAGSLKGSRQQRSRRRVAAGSHSKHILVPPPGVHPVNQPLTVTRDAASTIPLPEPARPARQRCCRRPASSRPRPGAVSRRDVHHRVAVRRPPRRKQRGARRS